MRLPWFLYLLSSCCIGLAGQAGAEPQAAAVSADLSIKDGKTTFKQGEPIELDLTLRALGSTANVFFGLAPQPDEIIFTRLDGGLPWKSDRERWIQSQFDVYTQTTIPPGQEWHTNIVLNDSYRFDQAGSYSLRVLTRRAGELLETNAVSFSVQAADPQAEAAQAAALSKALRETRSPREAESLATTLGRLSGDAATKVKLDLLLGPPIGFDSTLDAHRVVTNFIDFTPGLWFSHNRQMIVDALEKTVMDPSHVPAKHALVYRRTLASWEVPLMRDELLYQCVTLKSSLVAQGMPDHSIDTALTRQVASAILHQFAATLPQRQGESRFQAAWIVLQFHRDDPSAWSQPDFIAARDIVNENFARLSGFELAGLLNGYGQAFDETKVTDAVLRYLERHRNDNAALSFLLQRRVSVAAPYVIHEACTGHSMYVPQFRELPVETLAGVDDCLRERLNKEAGEFAAHPDQSAIGITLEFVARFATPALMPDVARILPSLQGKLVANAALVYLMRWDPQTYAPMFEAALAAFPPDGLNTLDFTLQQTAYAPAEGIRAIFRRVLFSGSVLDAKRAASVLSSIGMAEDRPLLIERLQQLRDKLRSGEPAPGKGEEDLEATLAHAVLPNQPWSHEEWLALRSHCVSAPCKRSFRIN